MRKATLFPIHPTVNRGMVWLLAIGLATPPILPVMAATPRQAPRSLESAEQALNRLIRSRFDAPDLVELATGRRWLEISLEQALHRALGENITLARSSLQPKMAEQTVVQADSAFDAVVALTMGTVKNSHYYRSEMVNAYHSPTHPCQECSDRDNPTSRVQIPPNDIGYLLMDPDTTPVWYTHFTTPRPGGLWKGTLVEASAKDKVPAAWKSNYTLGVTKALPWGASGWINQNTQLERTYYTMKGGDDDPSYGSYHRPWSSSAGAGVALRVPGGKDFGRHATREVAVAQGELGVKRTGLADLAQQEAILLAVEQAYWQLVGSMHLLDTAMANRRTVAALAAKTARLLEAGKVTQYAKSQIETELARSGSQEALAAGGMITASNALNVLLDYDRQALFLPVGYTKALTERLEVPLEEALAQGQAGNFELQGQDVERESADLAVHHREVQARPDVTVKVSVTASQVASPIGYGSYGQSIGNLASPDKMTVNTGVTYRYPVMNRGAEARVAQAQAEKARQEIARQEVAGRVNRQVMNAYITLKSARERVRLTKRNLDLAGLSYRKALELQEAEEGRVTEYEILVKNNQVTQAREQYIQAQVATKRAEAALLSAMGELARRRVNLAAAQPHGEMQP